MDKDALVSFAGALRLALGKLGVSVRQGMYVHTAADGRWHLVLSTASLGREGPLALHALAARAAHTIPFAGLKPAVSFVHPNDPVFAQGPARYAPVQHYYAPPSSSVSSVSSGVTFGPADSVIFPAWDALLKKD